MRATLRAATRNRNSKSPLSKPERHCCGGARGTGNDLSLSTLAQQPNAALPVGTKQFFGTFEFLPVEGYVHVFLEWPQTAREIGGARAGLLISLKTKPVAAAHQPCNLEDRVTHRTAPKLTSWSA
jgi:hypothetical protein